MFRPIATCRTYDVLPSVLHLGDYPYEYGNATVGDGTALGRVPNPDREILSLID